MISQHKKLMDNGFARMHFFNHFIVTGYACKHGLSTWRDTLYGTVHEFLWLIIITLVRRINSFFEINK